MKEVVVAGRISPVYGDGVRAKQVKILRKNVWDKKFVETRKSIVIQEKPKCEH